MKCVNLLMLKVALTWCGHGLYWATDTLEAQIMIDISYTPGWIKTIFRQV